MLIHILHICISKSEITAYSVLNIELLIRGGGGVGSITTGTVGKKNDEEMGLRVSPIKKPH